MFWLPVTDNSWSHLQDISWDVASDKNWITMKLQLVTLRQLLYIYCVFGIFFFFWSRLVSCSCSSPLLHFSITFSLVLSFVVYGNIFTNFGAERVEMTQRNKLKKHSFPPFVCLDSLPHWVSQSVEKKSCELHVCLRTLTVKIAPTAASKQEVVRLSHLHRTRRVNVFFFFFFSVLFHFTSPGFSFLSSRLLFDFS